MSQHPSDPFPEDPELLPLEATWAPWLAIILWSVVILAGFLLVR